MESTASGDHSSILMVSPIKATPPKAEREVSMTMEVRELLSWVGLDMCGHVSENSTPKRLNPMVLLTPLPIKLGNFPGPVDTLSQVSTPHDAETGNASLEGILTAPSPTAKTPGPSGGAPPTDAGHLQEEANKALGGLPATKSSINTHWQKLVWSWAWLFTEMILKQQNPTRKPRPSAPIPCRKLLLHNHQGR